jgi:hypothetical protein
MKGLDWSKVSGGHTRTDVGLKYANEVWYGRCMYERNLWIFSLDVCSQGLSSVRAIKKQIDELKKCGLTVGFI